MVDITPGHEAFSAVLGIIIGIIDYRWLLLRPDKGDYGGTTCFKFSWNIADDAYPNHGTKVV